MRAKRFWTGPGPAAALAGILAAGLLLGVAELAGSFFRAAATPLVALGSTFIDFTPVWLKNFAVDTFGTNDKLVLFISMGIVMAALAAVAGYLAYRRWAAGITLLLLLSTVVAAAVVTRSGAEPTDVLPTLLGVLAGVLTLRWMTNRLHREHPPVTGPGGAPSPEAGASGTPGRSTGRRSFLAAAGLTAAAAAAAALAGELLAGTRRTVERTRSALRLPRAARPAAPLPAGVQSPVAGVTPFVTPAKDFYRIDTALAVPSIDAASWELRVHGMVEQEVRMSFNDLLTAELIESYVTLTCVSNPVGGNLAGNAKWLGYPLRKVLEKARPTAGADMVLSTSSDGFSASTPLGVLQDDRDAILAIGMNGEPLPLEHGYPVRMVVPGLYGFVSATKWVVDLEVTRFQDKRAYWTDRGWSDHGPVKTSSRIEVPKSFARVKAGKVAVGGTAWSQHRGITKVEIQIDDGPWQEAVLAAEASIDTWRQWSFQWEATPGNHDIRTRATDRKDGLQTEQRANPIPDGASGWQSVNVTVE
ncbi:molybdopterin-dependent oxidoreductase [Paenarthrobacter sp. DKR-5]|uniref:molybdopterin-dependent oxidoreductase n=1 Tax=Paenarthrobacter sp. DKR-5 TaxID=2835535 RepID=UPI001BDBBA3B|nr:molybdopterin-dependent oxidoreductase [Paenarthrobacter sp. DKR-5]MBT1004447.1 molybdopterin-dependent oxidoreductase [Paenarthrobacter sp. DKR-5]